MTDHDPYGGLPSLERLEGEVRELAARSNKGWVGRNWRRLTAVGAAVLAIGFAVSPVGPAFGGPDGEHEVTAEAPIACPTFEDLDGRELTPAEGGSLAPPCGDALVPACAPLERIAAARPEIAEILRDEGPEAALDVADCPPFAEEPLPGVFERAPRTGTTGPAGARSATSERVPAPVFTCAGDGPSTRKVYDIPGTRDDPGACGPFERVRPADSLR